jgi:thiol-disulfide isomerase/thioredoxin
MRTARAVLLVLLVGAAAGAAAEAALELETLTGEPVALARREEDAALLVHFFATWCPECEEELPILAEAKTRCRGSGVRIVTVSVGESREVLVSYLAKHGLALEPLRDPRGRTWRSLGGVGLPTNLVWTSERRSIEAGPRDAEGWRRSLRELGCTPSPPSGGEAGEMAPRVE